MQESMTNRMSIKQIFIWLAVVLSILVAVVISLPIRSGRPMALEHAHQSRYSSPRWPMNCAAPAEDMTKFARAYVTTGDPNDEDRYYMILDIRNGKRLVLPTMTASTGTWSAPASCRWKPAPRRCRCPS
jgi:methyl-accepting chemotaxis protein